MTTLTNTATPLHASTITSPQNRPCKISPPIIRASFPSRDNATTTTTTTTNTTNTTRRTVVTTFLTTSLAVLWLQSTPPALAENWGTRSFIRERFFEPGLSPKDAVARIRQTAEGLHSLREMVDNMSWRYVLFYIRLKSAYLSQDLKNAMSTLPQGRVQEYVKTANELVDNMAEFDSYVRTPKVYESYLYYEKTLKSLDEIVAILG